mgnify:CR=1 FL=1
MMKTTKANTLINTIAMKQAYFAIFLLIFSVKGWTQQDPQYTQYMYATQVVNPAYVGSEEALSFNLLYRTQWVGFEGAPKTGTFTVGSPIGNLDDMGLGLSIVRDEIGPAIESNVVVDYSYAINLSLNSRLAFGVKAGFDILDVDFTKLNIGDPDDPFFQNNIDNRFQPQVGAGIYFNTQKFYAGLSVPNFLETKHFDEAEITSSDFSRVAQERIHFFLITGYVFDVSENFKFKPAAMVKATHGSPIALDISGFSIK